jgi:pyruvate/2-oxoglutarate dehydrogenase complex dihydrolipoamide dehydrogenase (E3) component
LCCQNKKLGVEIKTDTVLDQRMIVELAPDIIINATGSFPVVPPIEGAEQEHVFVAEDVMLERKKAGKRVAIVGGGGTGCEAAEWLVDRGHEVAIFEMMAHIGANIEQITRRWMYYELRKAGAQLLTRSKVVRIAGDKLVYSDANGEEKVYECDTVLIALGYRPTDDLAFCDDDGFPIPTYRIGDADRPGTILDAVTAGANIAARI